LPIAAAYTAQHVHDIKIALLGPIVPQSNPVLLAEEMAMLDNMAEGRLVVGMLRHLERDDDLLTSIPQSRASAPTRAWN
jgi:alkanesulfonate monooxygenase SsuD/methylene tetrahydromethanopterin reductase-like flavin-dependent oxidoreductase (luciferase family)